MANQLKMADVQAIQALVRLGWSYRRIARELEVDRDTVSRYARQEEVSASNAAMALSGSVGPPPASNPAIALTGSEGPAPVSNTPRHKGNVENGVKYVKNNALKGRSFCSLAQENQHLPDWEFDGGRHA